MDDLFMFNGSAAATVIAQQTENHSAAIKFKQVNKLLIADIHCRFKEEALFYAECLRICLYGAFCVYKHEKEFIFKAMVAIITQHCRRSIPGHCASTGIDLRTGRYISIVRGCVFFFPPQIDP